MKRFNLWRTLILCSLLLALASAALAQEATIVGTVTDPSGAPVPNVAITITNTDTGVVRKTTTNAVGQFAVPDLHIGRTTVRAEAGGFKSAEQKDILLQVGERERVDIRLELGSTQESVNVEANAIAVQTDSGEISDVITGQQVSQLATNGRSLYSLAFLTAGATANMADFQSPTPVGGDANVSFNGMRENHNLWTIDGGEDSDRGGAGGIDVMPSVDAIAEFRVLSSNYSAEYGLSSAATMTMAIKSGTKDFHASAWEFVRNDALDANTYFFNQAGTKPPELRFNTYGFNGGGPVYIPGIPYNKDKDKTFFFYNMEWRKLVQGSTTNQTVPLASTYTGTFNSAITDPLTNSPFPNNVIPANRLDANAQALLKAGIFPAATSGTQFVGGAKTPTDVREEIVRIDHRFSDKFWIFGHWVGEQISQSYGTSLWSGDNVPTVGSVLGNPSRSGVVRATYSISPTLLNETAFNYNGNQLNIVPSGLYQRPSGFSVPELFPGNSNNRIPEIQLSGATGTTYDVSSWPWHNKADDYQIRDDISWTRGSHQLKFGASWALYKKVQDLFGDTQGNFNFNGSYTGNDFADFLLGDAHQYTELAVQDHGDWNNVSWALYVQDNWRVNSRLTLNLGIRWDGVPHTYEASNRGSNFYPSLYSKANAAVILSDGTISPSSPGLGTSPNPILTGLQFYLNGIGIAGKNGISNGLVQNHWAAFGPRIGIAYDTTGKGKTIIRGGFGMMYERIQGNDMYNGGPNLPFSSSVQFNDVTLSNPKTSLLTGQTLSAPITVGSITGISDSDYRLPTSFQYSIGVQHELFRDSVLSVSYVGNQNRHQTIYGDINLPDSSVLPSLINSSTTHVAYNTVVPYLGFHTISLVSASENSHYNGLQMNFKSQMRKDLTLQVAYTYSHTVDMNNSFGGDLDTVSNPYNRKYDYGTAYSDAAHVGLVNFIYQMPFFRDSKSRVVKSVLGGWDLSGIVSMMSGFPLNMSLGGTQGSNGLASATNRPNYSGNVSYPGSQQAWFSTSSFSLPSVGAWGNLSHGAIRGPGRDNWNMSLFKSFMLSEERGSRIEFRAESFNTWNHTQFRAVSTTYTNSNFGQVTSTWDPRVFQLGAKLIF